MEDLKIAVAQFEPKDGDKTYNLGVIEFLTEKAKNADADVISFHELSITAYTHLSELSRDDLVNLGEVIPGGESCQKLIQMAAKYHMTILAGLVEIEDDEIFNTYICVNENGLIARHRKIHPFISPYLSPGKEYTIFNINSWTCGILTCYDNNIIENVRATALLGANLIFAPHVTGCTPSPMPGRGFVEDTYWRNRYKDPQSLRTEFDGPKGRGWIMRWLPARAYDNGVYYAFSNPIGYDGNQLKNGNSMILDPFGEVLVEVTGFENDIAIATLSPDKLEKAGGFRYRQARKPELYKDIIGKEHKSETKPVWMED